MISGQVTAIQLRLSSNHGLQGLRLGCGLSVSSDRNTEQWSRRVGGILLGEISLYRVEWESDREMDSSEFWYYARKE
jgi:hypothetical protein